MSKKQVMAEIIRHTSLSDGIFDMTLKAEEIAKEAKAGQFISVYLNNKSKILPRPISICGIDKEAGTLRIVYRTVGDGTKELSDYKEGEMVKILGPLGNGFTQKDKKAILIGGGIGIPPMLELMKQLDCDKTAVLGYRDSDMFLKDEFEAVGDVVISTEDGSFGTKGNVIDAIKEQGVEEASSNAGVQHQCFEESKHMQKRGDRSTDFHGRENGMWNRCMLSLCLQVKRRGFPFTCS